MRACRYEDFNVFIRDYNSPFEMPERLKQALAAGNTPGGGDVPATGEGSGSGSSSGSGGAEGDGGGDEPAGDEGTAAAVVHKRYFRCMQNRTEVYKMVTGAMKRVRVGVVRYPVAAQGCGSSPSCVGGCSWGRSNGKSSAT